MKKQCANCKHWQGYAEWCEKRCRKAVAMYSCYNFEKIEQDKQDERQINLFETIVTSLFDFS